jgi:hypothetical protein
MIALTDYSVRQAVLERLRLAYCSLPPLSARDTRGQLKRLVPEANGAELDRALDLAGFADDGRS